ncbi:hypothetical protein D3C72_1438790 [compost metagenome]
MLMIREKDNSRFNITLIQPFLGLGLIPQMMLIESWISANTVVAPNNKVAPPITAAIVDFPESDALLTKLCTWLAASAPI